MDGRPSWDGSWLSSVKNQHDSSEWRDVRESIDTSCTVVMGPSSGTLTFRLRMRLCSLMRILKPVTAVGFSLLSPFCPMANANACSGSSAFAGGVAAGLSLGKSWYNFLSGCCILQAKGLSPDGDALPSDGEALPSEGEALPNEGEARPSCEGVTGELWPTAGDRARGFLGC